MNKVVVTSGSLKFDGFANLVTAAVLLFVPLLGDLHWAFNILMLISVPYFVLEAGKSFNAANKAEREIIEK